MTKIGSARIDENGNAVGGKAGDQTLREVAIENYYNHPLGWWVLRAKTAATANKLAKAMKAACDQANEIKDTFQQAQAYHDVAESFPTLRKPIDKLEELVDNKLWPLPKYRELLFIN